MSGILAKLGLNSGSYRPFKIVLVCLEIPFDFLIDWCLIFELQKSNLQNVSTF